MSQELSRFAKSQLRFLLVALFAIVALIGSSATPALAERDEPGLPVDLEAYCGLLGYELIIQPSDLDDPDGKSWRCATLEWTVSESSSTGCEAGAGVEVSVRKLPGGSVEVRCSWEDGQNVTYVVKHMESIDVNAACAVQYGNKVPGTNIYESDYVADSYDWSDPYAWGCYLNVVA